MAPSLILAGYPSWHAGYGYFALELKGEGKVIGQAGLMKTSFNGRSAVELGYILDDSYWHMGYASEAARECLRYASVNLGLDKVGTVVKRIKTL